MFSTLFTFDSNMDWKVNDVIVAAFEESPDHLTNTITT